MPDATTNKPVRISPTLLGAGVLVILLGFGLPALVSQPQAQPQPQPPPQAPPAGAEAFAPRPGPPALLQNSPGNIGLALVRLVVSLAVVCGGCVLVVRYLGKKKIDTPSSAMIVVASLTVGRCAVHLVRAGDRRMLIGTDASGVKALVELPGAEPTPELVPNAFLTDVPEAHAA